MWSRRVLNMSAKVIGDRGTMHVFNFVAPQFYNLLSLTVDGQTRRERVRGEPTYNAQLRRFAASVLRGEPSLTPAEDAVTTMRLIDDVYAAAGLPLRGLPDVRLSPASGCEILRLTRRRRRAVGRAGATDEKRRRRASNQA